MKGQIGTSKEVIIQADCVHCLLKWSLLLRTGRWRWMMHWATLSDLVIGALPRLMDCWEPTNHHLPRGWPEEYDSSRYNSSAVRADYWQNDNGTEDKRRPGNICWIDIVMSMILHERRDSQRIDAVFDVYRDNSNKNPERERREARKAHKFRNIKADHKIHQWRKFLSNSKSKSLLIKFSSEEWQNERKDNLCNDRGLLLWILLIGVTARD